MWFLGGLVAAPAVVRATSLMKVVGVPELVVPRYLTINDITCEAVRLWRNSNVFLAQYEEEVLLGTSLRIRLPNDYQVLSPV